MVPRRKRSASDWFALIATSILCGCALVILAGLFVCLVAALITLIGIIF